MRLCHILIALLGAGLWTGPAVAQLSEPILAAKTALEEGDAEGVFQALFEKELKGDETFLGAELLSMAADKMMSQGDYVMTLQLCQMSLKHDPENARGLSVCARASRMLDQYGPAEQYAYKLATTHPERPEGSLLRARISADQAEWDRAEHAAIEVVENESATDLEIRQALAIRDKAREESRKRESILSKVEVLSEKLDAAKATIRKGNYPVVVYSTTWCGYCKRAIAWLKLKKVDFVVRDVEKDPGARAELARRAEKARMNPRGVPVIAVKNDMMVGWSSSSAKRMLQKNGLWPKGQR